MKKLILASFLFLIAISASAAEINFLDNPVWSTVLEKAKKEKKLIFLDGYATWCGPCKKMDAETYKDQAVADYYNANFINVRYDMEKGEGKELAEKYLVSAYPNLIFVDPEGVLLHKGIGYLEANEFMALGTAAKNPDEQYYTLKKKALTLTNNQFEKFAAMAVAFEDEDIEQMMNQYLNTQPDILASEALIKIIMLHVTSLPTEKMLAYVKDNEAKIIKSGEFTSSDFEERLVSLALGFALSDANQTDENNIDFVTVENILTKYTPEKAFFVSHYFQAQYLLGNKKIDESMAQFNMLLENVPAKLSYDQVCNALIAMGPEFAKAGKIEPLLAKFDAIKIPAQDESKAYMKEFVRAIIYIKNGETEKFKLIANSMIAKPDSAVPANVKEDIKAALANIQKKN